MDYEIPQHRERICIIGFRKSLGINIVDFHYPELVTIEKNLKQSLKYKIIAA